MITQTFHYYGEHFSEYAKERATLISDGWELLDENLIKYRRNFSGTSIHYVKGSVVFKKTAL